MNLIILIIILVLLFGGGGGYYATAIMAARGSAASSALFWSWSSYCGFSAASASFLNLAEFGVPPRLYICSS